MLLLSPFYRRGDWGTEQINNVVKVTQLGSGSTRKRIRPLDLASSGLTSSHCPWWLNSIRSRTWVFFPVGLIPFPLPPSFPLARSCYWCPYCLLFLSQGREEEAKGRDWKTKGRSCWETPEDARRRLNRWQEAFQMLHSERFISQGIFFPETLLIIPLF